MVIVYFVRRKNKKIAQPGPDDSRKNVTVIKTDEDNVPHEHEPGIKKDNPILIFLKVMILEIQEYILILIKQLMI